MTRPESFTGTGSPRGRLELLLWCTAPSKNALDEETCLCILGEEGGRPNLGDRLTRFGSSASASLHSPF